MAYPYDIDDEQRDDGPFKPSRSPQHPDPFSSDYRDWPFPWPPPLPAPPPIMDPDMDGHIDRPGDNNRG